MDTNIVQKLETIFHIDNNSIVNKISKLRKNDHKSISNWLIPKDKIDDNTFQCLQEKNIIITDPNNLGFVWFVDSLKTMEDLKQFMIKNNICKKEMDTILFICNKKQEINLLIHLFLKDYKFNFGDLIAFGDHYKEPEEIERLFKNLERKDGKGNQKFMDILNAVNYQHENMERWFSNINKKPYNEKNISQSILPDCYKPTTNEKEIFAFLPDYSYLARNNYDHFGESAWNKWEKIHKKVEQDANKIAKKIKNDENYFNDSNFRYDLIKLLCYEGFAQHFLTDAFAAGHIRTKRKKTFLNLSQSPAIAEHKHDYDNFHGLYVKMSLPWEEGEKKWKSYGDHCLFTPHGRENLENILKMSYWSLKEVLEKIFCKDFIPGISKNFDKSISEYDFKGKKPNQKKVISRRNIDLNENNVTKANKVLANNVWRRPTPYDNNPEPPICRWSGMSYSFSYMFDEVNFKDSDGALRLDIGYQYGRSSFRLLPPANYLGVAIFFFPGNEKAFHLLALGSTTYLKEDYYTDLRQVDTWTGPIFFVDKWPSLICQKLFKLDNSDFPESLKFESKISGGPLYYTRNDEVYLRLEVIYNLAFSFRIYNALNFKPSFDLFRVVLKSGSFHFPEQFFTRVGLGFEFMF